MSLTYQIFTSPIGEILVAGNGYAVTYMTRGEDRHLLSSDFRLRYEEASPVDKSGYIREACSAIAAYLDGASTRIDVTVQVGGSDFQRKVWHALRQIPYGRTLSYSAIAEALGSPSAFRAVANACGANPTPLIIPCHRAVHKSGNAIGFGWGEDAKRYLLALESQHAAAPADQTA